jgi:hypothetical protein
MQSDDGRPDPFDDDDDDRAAVAQAAALAQEEEDAAMAKRLQEELYRENHGSGAGGGSDSPEGVRAPIAATTETLVAPDMAWGGHDDAEAAIFEQLRRRRHPPRKSIPGRSARVSSAHTLSFSSWRRALCTANMGRWDHPLQHRKQQPCETTRGPISTAVRLDGTAVVGRGESTWQGG